MPLVGSPLGAACGTQPPSEIAVNCLVVKSKLCCLCCALAPSPWRVGKTCRWGSRSTSCRYSWARPSGWLSGMHVSFLGVGDPMRFSFLHVLRSRKQTNRPLPWGSRKRTAHLLPPAHLLLYGVQALGTVLACYFLRCCMCMIDQFICEQCCDVMLLGPALFDNDSRSLHV